MQWACTSFFKTQCKLCVRIQYTMYSYLFSFLVLFVYLFICLLIYDGIKSFTHITTLPCSGL